jgi:hypothetical protein
MSRSYTYSPPKRLHGVAGLLYFTFYLKHPLNPNKRTNQILHIQLATSCYSTYGFLTLPTHIHLEDSNYIACETLEKFQHSMRTITEGPKLHWTLNRGLLAFNSLKIKPFALWVTDKAMKDETAAMFRYKGVNHFHTRCLTPVEACFLCFGRHSSFVLRRIQQIPKPFLKFKCY